MNRDLIGRTLAHYEIIAKLGQGGMGEVYRARDTKLARDVAVKVLPSELADSPERLERFRREAQAVAALNHPNIVTLFSVEEADGIHFLTMEYVEGVSLDRIIAGGGIGIERFFAIAVALSGAISAAHSKGITHRDLKPANVMVTDEGAVKILDFGLAKVQTNTEAAPTQMPTEGLTGEGVVMGTVSYMSPEQAEGKRIDHRSDIFSLGVVLYEMAAGARPFPGDSAAAIMGSILRDQPPPLAEIRPDMPRHLDRLVGACLEKDPHDRYQSSRDVYNELRRLRGEIETGSRLSTGDLATSSRGPLLSKWVALAIALIVVVVATLVGWPFVAGKFASQESETEKQAAVAESERKMIAVLPLRNLGAAEDEYFAAGISDEILSRLASVKGLGVVSTGGETPFRDQVRARTIGQDLGVDYILTGSVRWATSGEGESRVRVSPKLIRVEDETHLWAEVYDRSIDDIFEIQSEIAL
ncbi:MAG: protein kinase, partial [Acidobacteriota bacterium]